MESAPMLAPAWVSGPERVLTPANERQAPFERRYLRRSGWCPRHFRDFRPAGARVSNRPPEAEKPPVYSPSANAAHAPALFAGSTWPCAGTVSVVHVCLRETVEPLAVT